MASLGENLLGTLATQALALAQRRLCHWPLGMRHGPIDRVAETLGICRVQCIGILAGDEPWIVAQSASAAEWQGGLGQRGT